jgi:PAS domain S-box-containing protein
MTIEESVNEVESAACVANNSGRILSANKRFCKMFGFEQNEIKWHYLIDLYRRKDELTKILSNISEYNDTLQTKMRNRRGRSFNCILTRQTTKTTEGTTLLMHCVKKVID